MFYLSDQIRVNFSGEICVIVIPSITQYKYLKCLYKEVIESPTATPSALKLYSVPAKSSVFKSQLLFPFKILNLILRRKKCARDKVIIHIHWIEFLYRWGDNKFLIPFLIPSTITFFRIFKSLSKHKLALTLHNILPHKTYWLYIEYCFFRIMLRDLSDIVFVHSDLQKKNAATLYGLNSEKIHVIQHGFFKDPKLLSCFQNNQNRNKLGISSNEIVFSFIGKVSEYKGVTILLEALRELFQKRSELNIRFILAGEANRTYLRYLLRNYSDVLTDSRMLFIHKHLSEVELNDIFASTDFGICPYIQATTPATLFDFMCFHLPIITTNDPNILHMVSDYPLIIAKKGDSHSLVQAIDLAYRTVVEQKERIKNFGNMPMITNAWSTSASKTLDCYLNIVGLK